MEVFSQYRTSGLEICGQSNGQVPKCWDWRDVEGQNFEGPIKQQGDCGSCYAVSALGALESRIRIKTKNERKVEFSVGSALSCNRYNQGCNGGYPFLVAKFGHEFGFVMENCQSNTNLEMCDQKCFQQEKIQVKEYGYVGKGYYGSTNEQAIMKEIFDNGPVVVAFNASPDLYYYSSGVFLTNPKNSLTQSNEQSQVNPWIFTNHAVVCIGWGEQKHNDEVLKYWILKNSWGDDWGEQGYFKLLKGHNLAGIENQAIFMVPDV